MEILKILQREFVYVWYYFEIQLRQIAPYWALGMVLGIKRFILYLAFVMLFSLITGFIVNLIL